MVLVLGILLATVPAVADAAPPRPVARLVSGQWQAISPLGRVSGPYLSLSDGHGSWRPALAWPDEGMRPDLLRRHGRGWTLCGGPGAAFVQTWSSPWNQVGAGTAGFLSALSRTLEQAQGPWPRESSTAPASVRLILPSWDELPASWRPPTRRLADRGRLRRDLIERGLGAGGDGLVVVARDHRGGLRLTSARWPVTIELVPDADVPPRAEGWIPPAEAFLPLWPLADLLP